MKLKFHSKQYTACVQTLSSNIFCAKWSGSVGTNTFQRTAVFSHCSTGSVLFVFLAQLVSIHPSIHSNVTAPLPSLSHFLSPLIPPSVCLSNMRTVSAVRHDPVLCLESHTAISSKRNKKRP